MPLAPLTIYIVSFCVTSILDVPSDPTKRELYWEHSPLLLTAVSTEDAKAQARDTILYNWPKERGWKNRSAVLRQISNPFIADLQGRGLILPDEHVLIGEVLQISDDDPSTNT